MDNTIAIIYDITRAGFWKFLFSITLVFVTLETIYMLVGLLLAIPTDYGRIFAFSMSFGTGYVYVYLILIFLPVKLLLTLRKISEKSKNLA